MLLSHNVTDTQFHNHFLKNYKTKCILLLQVYTPMSSDGGGSNEVRDSNAKLSEVIYLPELVVYFVPLLWDYFE
jgi:hypothetical protein